ncbi:MAG TPA: 4'-phosphopantetheinyl transferase superfamily protein [Tahibacter sp.]|nr:4'-phosphopantetheinyl transferase superfamily protein [Tahibacter sp.]
MTDDSDATPCRLPHVRLWLADVDDVRDEALVARYHALMNDAERERQRRFVFERDRHRYLVTRALVRSVLARCVDRAPADLAFVVNDYGKPALAGASRGDLAFNVSHAGSLVALAVSRGGALGVDVEHAAQPLSYDELADHHFAREEADALRALPAERRRQRFFEHWTLKESYIKARGMGLSLPLDRFGFRLDESGNIALWTQPDVDDAPQRWRFAQFAVGDYIVAACAQSAVPIVVDAMRCVPLAGEAPMALAALRSSHDAQENPG